MTAAAPRDACAMLMKPAEVANVVNRWQKDAFAWLDETLSARASGEDPLYLATLLTVVDRLTGILAGLLAMVMVARYYGSAGLGIFAWYFK